MNFRFLTPALTEIREAAEFYEHRVSGLGADFLDEVDAAMERLLTSGFSSAFPLAIRPPFL